MGLTMKNPAMPDYFEQTTERLYTDGGKTRIVSADDPRARILVAIHGPVTEKDAQIIRGYENGAEFLESINPTEDTPPGDIAPEDTPTGGTLPEDYIVDWGNKYKGQRLGDLENKYLVSLTKGRNPEDRKALARAELVRRGN